MPATLTATVAPAKGLRISSNLGRTSRGLLNNRGEKRNRDERDAQAGRFKNRLREQRGFGRRNGRRSKSQIPVYALSFRVPFHRQNPTLPVDEGEPRLT